MAAVAKIFDFDALTELLIIQGELVKLHKFRRFLRSCELSQLDFLLKVEQLRRDREQETHNEQDLKKMS